MRSRTHRKHRQRHHGGGWFDGLQNGWQGLTRSTKNWWSGTSTSSNSLAPLPPAPAPLPPAPAPLPPAPAPAPSEMQQQQQQPMQITGGRKSKRSRKSRRNRRRCGGSKIHGTESSSLALHAAPFDGVPTAQPQAWVGGKRRRHRRSRSRRHRHTKHCKH